MQSINRHWLNFSVLALLVLALAIFLFFSPMQTQEETREKTFLEKYSQLSLVWKDKGVETDRFHESFPGLLSLDEQTLQEIKLGLEPHSYSEDERISLLASAYSDSLSFALETARHEHALETVRGIHESPTCETFPHYNQLSLTSERLLISVSNYQTKVDSFVERYPREAEEVHLETFEFDAALLIKQLNTQKESVEFFKGVCFET